MSRPANVMIDLETLDNKPGALILAIGACEVLPPNNMDNARTFSGRCNFDYSDLFTISPETVKWWMQFPDKFLKIIDDEQTSEIHRMDTKSLLLDFSTWIHREIVRNSWENPLSDSEILVWGDGSDFDIIILEEAMRRLKVNIPWTYRSHRCYRTIRSILSIGEKKDYISPEDLHNAEKDAIGQAKHLSVLLDHLGYWEKGLHLEYGKEKNHRSN